ncbi:MAG: YggS family pyridoxal phosphate-dependent enzyme [Pseudomonadota bacterium]
MYENHFCSDQALQCLSEIRNQIAIAEYGRKLSPIFPIQLIAVSKKQSDIAIRALFKAGQKSFGENYLQEAVTKQKSLLDLAIDWHFIGAIQSNKTALIAENFHWCHSLDRLKIAQRLDAHCKALNKTLNVLIQINIDESPSKGGIFPNDLELFAKELMKCHNLRWRGLMCFPDHLDENLKHEKSMFDKTYELFLTGQKINASLDTLSMGTSGNFTQAIRCGSTMVRIGESLFGTRQKQ